MDDTGAGDDRAGDDVLVGVAPVLRTHRAGPQIAAPGQEIAAAVREQVDGLYWVRSATLKDPVAGAALKPLHAAPLEVWSVDRLAKRVGVSRTELAERFKHYLDQPPMQYLPHWRLQIAARMLKTSDLPMKAIAEQNGYESEVAFGPAFKRCFGLPPGDWRKRQAGG